jgi:uncharacterized membrane protein
LVVDKVRYWRAVLFYFGFALGVIYFAVMPALREGSATIALLNGALIGLLTYTTYDAAGEEMLRDPVAGVDEFEPVAAARMGEDMDEKLTVGW